MAEPKIRTINLFKSVVCGSGSAGGTSDSDTIDLRDISRVGQFSLSYTIAKAGAAGTCASTKISFVGSPVYGGPYVTPTGGTCATIGAAGGSDIITITPPVLPFMKIRVVAGTSGTALVSGDLHVR